MRRTRKRRGSAGRRRRSFKSYSRRRRTSRRRMNPKLRIAKRRQRLVGDRI